MLVRVPLAELPGHELWQSLMGAVGACGVPDGEREELSMLVWAGLHGVVSLSINKPSFPWPPLHQLVDGHLRRMLAGSTREVTERKSRPR